jgi:hypothetical protein
MMMAMMMATRFRNGSSLSGNTVRKLVHYLLTMEIYDPSKDKKLYNTG